MDVQHPGDFPSTESHGLGKVVAEGEYSQYNKNVEVLFGGQAQFVVPLNLPHHLHLAAIGKHEGASHLHLAAIGKHLRALDFDLANTLADSTLQYGKGDGGEIFFLYGKVDKCRFGVVFGHVWAFRTQSASSVFVTLVRHFVLQIYDQARAEPLFLLVSTHQTNQNSLPRASQCWCWLGLTKP